MSEWENFRLRDIGTLKRGKSKHRPRYAFHLYNGPYPFIQTGEIRESKKVITSYSQSYSDAGLMQSKLWPKGTLCITIAANIAELAILGFDACFPDSVLGFIADDKKADINFVYYQLSHYQKELKHLGEGSVQDNINLATFDDILFPIPPLPEQQAIAEVLSSLDDKIDLLHRNNKTLEEMAETLFRQWFVEGAKEEWEVVPFGQLVQVKRGGSPRPIQEYLSESGLRWLKISDATNNNSPYILEIKEHIIESGLKKTVYLQSGSLVVSNSATPGIPKILALDTCIHDGWLYFPKSHFSNEFLYLFFLKIREELVALGNGSIFTNLKTDLVKTFPIAKPDDNTLSKFNDVVSPIFQKILSNSEQIMLLTNMKNALLPKLMSGQLRVKKN